MRLPSVLFLFFFTISVSAENCALGTRFVTIYPCSIDSNSYVNQPNPRAHYKKLQDFYNLVVAKIKKNQSCITFGGFNDSVEPDTSEAGMYTSSAPVYSDSSVPADCDYLFMGKITSEGATTLFTPEIVGAGDAIELTPLTPITLENDFDPDNGSNTVAASVGSLYDYVTTWERTKREQGAPYAVNPTVVLKPTKRILDFNESATINVAVTDCDGATLASRGLSFSVSEGGTLVPANTITDANGTSDIAFTAGNTPAIAVITARFSYTTPAGKKMNCDVAPLAIQIRKPVDCWYVQAEYDMTSSGTESFTAACGSNTSQGTKILRGDSKLFVAAWIQNIGSNGRFASNPIPIKIACAGFNDETGSGFTSSKGFAMAEQGVSNLTKRETVKKGGAPKCVFTIQPASVNFSVRDVPTIINGFEITSRAGYDKQREPPSYSESSSNNLADESTTSGNTQGPAQDTSFNEVSDTEFEGLKIHEVHTVKQKFLFDGKIGIFDRTDTYTQDKTGKVGVDNCGREEVARSTETFIAKITLEYSGDNSLLPNSRIRRNNAEPIGTLVSRKGLIGVKLSNGFKGDAVIDVFNTKGRLVTAKLFSSQSHASICWLNEVLPASGIHIVKIRTLNKGPSDFNAMTAPLLLLR
jgi:hypothetical protein